MSGCFLIRRRGNAGPTGLAGSSPADFSNVEVRREFATSRDGTKVPLNIICRRGTLLNSNNPTLLYGYGGYGVNLSPNFAVGRSVWLEQGGVYVIANLRGGGEYGEEWHRGGNLTHKQNVFDDFAAAARYLLDNGWTRTNRLAVEGRSNGGLLMGAFLTQHPDLARAVVSGVGIYDSLRSELEPNGAFNITGIWHGERSGAIQGAVCLLAVSQCPGWRFVSGGFDDHRGS